MGVASGFWVYKDFKSGYRTHNRLVLMCLLGLMKQQCGAKIFQPPPQPLVTRICRLNHPPHGFYSSEALGMGCTVRGANSASFAAAAVFTSGRPPRQAANCALGLQRNPSAVFPQCFINFSTKWFTNPARNSRSEILRVVTGFGWVSRWLNPRLKVALLVPLHCWPKSQQASMPVYLCPFLSTFKFVLHILTKFNLMIKFAQWIDRPRFFS